MIQYYLLGLAALFLWVHPSGDRLIDLRSSQESGVRSQHEFCALWRMHLEGLIPPPNLRFGRLRSWVESNLYPTGF